MSETGRLRRERKTVRLMVEMYCSHHHGGDGLCSECTELADYADRKLDLCPFGPEKPTCDNCPIHCYRPEPRERMREVMRYSGPRMLKNHPYLAIRHIFDGKREAPPLPKKERPG
ncbi:nitrous oxide-stimulated promoter family protein [Acidobacteriota bacterium]